MIFYFILLTGPGFIDINSPVPSTIYESRLIRPFSSALFFRLITPGPGAPDLNLDKWTSPLR